MISSPALRLRFWGMGELTMKRLFLLAAVMLSLSLQMASAQQSAPTTRRGGKGAAAGNAGSDPG